MGRTLNFQVLYLSQNYKDFGLTDSMVYEAFKWYIVVPPLKYSLNNMLL